MLVFFDIFSPIFHVQPSSTCEKFFFFGLSFPQIRNDPRKASTWASSLLNTALGLLAATAKTLLSNLLTIHSSWLNYYSNIALTSVITTIDKFCSFQHKVSSSLLHLEKLIQNQWSKRLCVKNAGHPKSSLLLKGPKTLFQNTWGSPLGQNSSKWRRSPGK